jgi:hypothetical protein
MEKHYWVYLPEINEAGCVVEADSLDSAFRKGCDSLYPDDGVEVQVHELGESQSYTAGGTVEPEPTGDEYVKTRAFLLDLAERHANGEADTVGREVTEFLDDGGSVTCLLIASRFHAEHPKVSTLLAEIKGALLDGIPTKESE